MNKSLNTCTWHPKPNESRPLCEMSISVGGMFARYEWTSLYVRRSHTLTFPGENSSRQRLHRGKRADRKQGLCSDFFFAHFISMGSCQRSGDLVTPHFRWWTVKTVSHAACKDECRRTLRSHSRVSFSYYFLFI